ncbi:MAG: serine hydrolase [Oscillatoria sp. PMC 1051.18]|nr:serine hydrolase [Oscillatoria sp. PMC 1050.18]MEC5030981.1 serine hydrolase [Oscillatoria sp. PMC 1051.18]
MNLKIWLLTLLLIFLQLIVPLPTFATTESPVTVLEKLFAEELQPEWFTPTFLRQVPLSQVENIINNIEETLGEIQEIQLDETDYRLIFERGTVLTKIKLNDNNQIESLLFLPPTLNSISLTEAIAKFRSFPGEVSFLVQKDNQVIAELNSNQPLAVGSAFKLAVLATLQQEIAAGKRNWDDVVKLQPEWKSLPSGLLQTWPNYTPLTLQTLATLTISISDNTATDALIQILGKESIETISPRNQPFLTTREAFILKNPQNQQLLSRYRQGNISQKSQLLREISQASLPDVTLFNGDPVALDVEWYFSSQELCNLISTVAELPLMRINPGVVNPQNWQRVAFKGGSEPGVFNLTTWLESKEGTSFCVVATINDAAPIDEAGFVSIYSSAIAGLRASGI